MIRDATGNIFDANVEALVNPVNTVGVVGTGLALQFKHRYPGMYREYYASCLRGEFKIGRVLVYTVFGYPRLVVNFPTKRHYQDPSKLEWIDAGLVDLHALIEELIIRSIAIPALGCGLGGLDWPDVRQLIVERLGEFTEVDILLYAPQV